jgi:hypothetical protein
LSYTTRYAYPFFGLTLLALLCVIRIEPFAFRHFAWVVLGLWACIIVGTIVYSQIAINTVLREPAPAAAAALRAEWDRQYSCGPAYLVGDGRSVWAIALYYGNGRTGVGFDEAHRRDWFDPERAKRQGVIAVTTPEYAQAPGFRSWFENRTLTTMSLPYRRTFKTNRHTYVYHLVPPLDCPTRPANRG